MSVRSVGWAKARGTFAGLRPAFHAFAHAVHVRGSHDRVGEGARVLVILREPCHAPLPTLPASSIQPKDLPMTSATDGPKTLGDAIDAVEETYEFMLAYAAQGRAREEPGDDIRDYLGRADAGLAIIAAMASPNGGGDDQAAFVEMVRQDAARARTAVRFVLGQRAIGSQMIDNLNASIHVRTLLTDLFLLDEALKISSG